MHSLILRRLSRLSSCTRFVHSCALLPFFREFSNHSIVDLATLPGREVGGVPLAAALGPHLAAEAALDVHQRLHVVRVVQDVPTQREENGNDGTCFM